MGFLKGIVLGLLSVLLFLSLLVFAVVYAVNGTVLNPDFMADELARLDMSAVIKDVAREESAGGADFPETSMTALLDAIEAAEPVVDEQAAEVMRSVSDYLRGRKEHPELGKVLGDTFLSSAFVGAVLDGVDLPLLVEGLLTPDMPEEVAAALLDTIASQEGEIKAQAAAASGPIFDYLLAETDSLDLPLVLRGTLASSDFVLALLEELDMPALVSEMLREELLGQIPEGMESLADVFDEVLADLEPTVKQTMADAADPMLDYVFGLRETLVVTIPLDTVKDDLAAALRQAIADNPPPQLLEMPAEQRDRLIEQFIAAVMTAVPPTYDVDVAAPASEVRSQVLSALEDAEAALTEARLSIAEAIDSAEAGLGEARRYFGYFQGAYAGLIALVVVLALAIVAIYHRVKGATRHLGALFLVYGIVAWLSIFLARSLASTNIAAADVPVPLRGFLLQMLTDVTAPVQTLGMGFVVGGLVLIAVSIIYPRLRSEEG
jgi:hypothetical protein